MNANEIINDEMSLEEKLKAIEVAMVKAQEDHREKFPGEAPLDPADLTSCEGCQ